MTSRIEFTRNYSDLSTERGFQFEFNCDRCGNGYRTSFKPSATGLISGAVDAASGLLGGVFGRAASLTDRVHSASWERAHDQAFTEGAAELRKEFAQCPRCSNWVCLEQCWNVQRGLCKDCAPDLGVEMAAAQSSRTVEEIWAHSRVAEEDREMLTEAEWRQGVRATCPECNEPLPRNVKFCPQCGASVKSVAHCTECGAKLTAGAKFCPECGTKAG
jgi:membrane protease subunit (stomatin/prohibitin family)